eukprot:SAG31_NODE_2446_length_5678_cov_9.411185_10_plen_94_part_00
MRCANTGNPKTLARHAPASSANLRRCDRVAAEDERSLVAAAALGHARRRESNAAVLTATEADAPALAFVASVDMWAAFVCGFSSHRQLLCSAQ